MAIGESRREVRITWIGFTVIFAVIGSILLYRERGAFVYFYGASGFFALFAAVAPMALLPLYRLWVKFAMVLAWFNTRLLLALVFYLVITPIGLGMRLLGHDPLERKIDKGATTYWKEKEQIDDVTRYEKQY
jgi:hypothetical protein